MGRTAPVTTELDRAWIRQLVPTFAVAWLACMGALMLIHVRRLAAATFGPGLHVQDLLHIVACASVTFAVLAAPVAALAAIVWVAAGWREDGELGAWTEAGVGPWRMARVPLAFGVAVSLATMPVAWSLEPKAHAALGARLVRVASANAWARLQPKTMGRIAGGWATVEGAQGPVRTGLRWSDGTTALTARRAEATGGALQLLQGRMRRWGHRIRFERAHLPLAVPSPGLRLGGDLSRPSPADLLARAKGPQRPRLLKEAHRRLAEPWVATALALWALAVSFARPWERRRQVVLPAAAGVALHYGMCRWADAVSWLDPAAAGWLPTAAVAALAAALLHPRETLSQRG